MTTATKQKPKRPEYRQPCECGACPKGYAIGRPVTLAEAVAHFDHDGWFGREKAFRLAVELHVVTYALWVNTKEWRKPRNWVSGNVPLSGLRPKGSVITPEMMRQVQATLLRGGRSGSGLG